VPALRLGPWGPRPGESAAPAVNVTTDGRFACDSCGAILSYAPGTETLACRYCGHVNTIVAAPAVIREQDLDDAFRRLGDASPPMEPVATRCTGCGAAVTFPQPLHAGPCPFCGTAVVAAPGGALTLQGVLPFLIGEAEARTRISGWLAKLWFAPSTLAKARGRDALRGIYVPFFTYDSRTETRYQGLRGDVYYDLVRVPVTVQGRRTTQVQKVPKIRWRPAAGVVRRAFDDVLVPASSTLPAHLADRLRRFDLHELRSYQEDYLAGFDSERYQLSLADGFERARAIMRRAIEDDARADMGGDMQKVTSLDVRHDGRSFKLVLLPVWRAQLGMLGRTYAVLVDGRSGQVVGERPYSVWKIALAVAAVGAVALALAVIGTVLG
jgi:predicted RNA-binding Zn-ribbon protein involved in translation (DUF1610 family)